jgi:hypothetical protein
MKNVVKRMIAAGFFAMATACSHAPVVTPAENSNSEIKWASAEVAKIDNDTPLFLVCDPMNERFDHLMKNASEKPDAKHAHFDRSVLMSVASEPAASYQFRVPELRAFIEWTDKAGENYWKLPEYKAQSEKAMDGLRKALKTARRIDLRSYYAAMIGRLMLARPAFAKNPAVMETCHSLENSLLEGSDSELPLKMRTLLKKAKVSAKEIQFNPKWQSSVEVRDPGKLPGYFNTVNFFFMDEFKKGEGQQ